MHCFSDYESEPSDPTLLHSEMVEFARWLRARRLIEEQYSEYNVSDFSAVRCAAAWEHINAGRVTYWTDYGADPYGIEEFVEFVGFKGSTELAEWLKKETAQAEDGQQSDDAAPKGKAGRRGYPLEALRYAQNLRRQNSTMKTHAIRLECLKKFDKDDLPPDVESFRRWMNRKRANRAN